jgi:hypothetical protein
MLALAIFRKSKADIGDWRLFNSEFYEWGFQHPFVDSYAGDVLVHKYEKYRSKNEEYK